MKIIVEINNLFDNTDFFAGEKPFINVSCSDDCGWLLW